MKVGYMQFEPRLGERDENLAHVLEGLDQVEADLMVLPELAFSGYAFGGRDEARRYAEDLRDSEVMAALVRLCRRRDMFIATGFAERAGEKIYNSAALLGAEGLISVYRKLHLFNTEKDCFDPGDLPPGIHSVRGVRVGMMICFDWIFPEVARGLALRGAELICHPSNLVIPEKCQYSMVTRCIENRVFAVTANRCGSERGIDFTGGSQAVAPGGELLHRSPAAGDEVYVFELDPRLARDKRINARNDLMEDRRLI